MNIEMEYKEKNGVLIPDLKAPEEEVVLGVWAARRKEYLKEYKKAYYYNLLTSGELVEHLSRAETEAKTMMESQVEKLKSEMKLSEELKAADPIGWAAQMNSVRKMAEEVILKELIYS